MNRKERRLKEKEKKREDNKKVEAMAWFKSLPAAKHLLIDSLIKIEARKENDSLLQAIDRCFSAAVFEELENLEWEDVKRIIDKSAELMLDDAHKMKNLKGSLGGSYDMAVKKINEMGPEIEARIRELIEAGYNQKVSVKILIEEFKEISTAMLTNAYKKTKAIIKDEEKAKLISDSIKEVVGESDKELEERIESYYDGENLFRSIKIRGEFSHMHVRMIPKSTPETKFAEVAIHQPEYSRDNVAGTIVGFWTPEIFHGVSVAGYHLHFISDDLTFGGHVMDFVIKEGIIEVGAVDQLDQRFPVQDRQYLFAKFNVDEMKKDIEKAE